MSFSLEIEHDDESIVGEITVLSHRDIAIKIVSPFEDLTNSLHIPYFAFMGQSGHPVYAKNDRLTSHGKKTAKGLLEELYEIGKTIHRNQTDLKEAYQQYQEAVMKLSLLIVLGREKIRKLRQKFKTGDFSQSQYQSELKETRDRIDGYEYHIHQLFGRYFEDYFDKTVGGGTKQDVVNYLSKFN